MTQKLLTYNTTDYDVFAGIDVDVKNFAVTFKDRYNMTCSKKMPSKPKQLYNYIKNAQQMIKQIM
jgi:transposase